MELLNALGVNLKILLAQFLNFAIFLFILWKFAYKPMLKFLDDRKEKIEKGITDAQKAEEKLVQIEAQEKETLAKATAEAKKQAQEIIEKATQIGEDKKEQMITKAKEEIQSIIKKEKESIKLERETTIKDIKKQTADLIAMSLKKVLNEKIDNNKDMEIIQKVLKDK